MAAPSIFLSLLGFGKTHNFLMVQVRGSYNNLLRSLFALYLNLLIKGANLGSFSFCLELSPKQCLRPLGYYIWPLDLSLSVDSGIWTPTVWNMSLPCKLFTAQCNKQNLFYSLQYLGLLKFDLTLTVTKIPAAVSHKPYIEDYVT